MASKESDCEGGDVRWCAPVKTQEDTKQLRTFTKLNTVSQKHIAVIQKKIANHFQ